MTKLTHNLGMKAVACFLVILSGLTSIISIITITFAGDCGFYADQPVPYAKTGQCAGTTYLYADRTMSWINSDVSISTLQERFAPDKTNFRFELFSKDGSQLLRRAQQIFWKIQSTKLRLTPTMLSYTAIQGRKVPRF